MKIGILLDRYNISAGGIQTAVTLLRRELEKKGVEVYLITKELIRVDLHPEMLSDDHIIVYGKNNKTNPVPINGVLSKKELIAKLKTLKIDILHAQFYDYKIVKYLKKHLTAKFVHTCNYCWWVWSLDTNPKFNKLKLENNPKNEAKLKRMIKWHFFLYGYDERRSRNLYDLGISISRYTDVYYQFMMPSSKIRKIPHAVDATKFANPDLEVVAQLKKDLNIKETDTVLFTHSRFSKEKKIYELIYDFSALNNKNFKLILIGHFTNKKYETKIKRLIKVKQIEDQIIFTELVAQDQLKNYFALADIGVYYSYSDSFWLAYLEFLAVGKPIVINQIDAIVGVIEDGKNGLIVNNTDEFVKAVNRLATDKELYQHIAKNSLPTVLEFSVDKYIDKMLAFYNEVLSL